MKRLRDLLWTYRYGQRSALPRWMNLDLIPIVIVLFMELGYLWWFLTVVSGHYYSLKLIVLDAIQALICTYVWPALIFGTFPRD